MRKPTLEQFIYNRHSKQSGDSYMYHINHFLTIHKKAAQFQYADIVKYMESLVEKHPNPSYRNTILAAIKKYYDYLVFFDHRTDHPCKKFVIRGKSRNIQVQELFSSTELQLLLNRENRYKHLESRNKAIIGLMIYQGLTNEEITKLTIHNIHFDKGEVYVKSSRILSRRKLSLKASQITHLYQYINEHREKLIHGRTNKLFIGNRGVAISADAVHAMIEQLKPLFPERKLSPATIRQSVISNWLNEQKISIEDVQQMAGHKWPSTTFKYVKKDANEQRRLINQFHPLG